jgi:hypothetical protein
MYDIVTTSLLFFVLAPGVLLTLPPGGSGLIVGLVHTIVFFVVLQFLSRYIPWWGIWLTAVLVAGISYYRSSAAAAPPAYY